jgi:uncharacterized repeat protein (TIGR04052 family)
MTRRREWWARRGVPVIIGLGIGIGLGLAACATDASTVVEAPLIANDDAPADRPAQPRPDTAVFDAGVSDARAAEPVSPPAAATREALDAAVEATRQAVTLRFAAKIGARDFHCGEVYGAQGSTGVSVEPADLRLFVQDVRLVRADGALVPVTLDERLPWQAAGVALLDFEDAQGSCAAGNRETNDFISGSVPAGVYGGVVFSNGVPEALNHADPATLPAPLQAGGMSWGWLLGYKFVVAELAELPAADAGVPDAGLPGFSLLHLGSTACTGNPGAGGVQCARPNRNEVRLDAFDPAASRVVIDVGALFALTDLRQQAQCHSAGEFCEPLFAGVGLAFTDGLPSGAQRVYRVE